MKTINTNNNNRICENPEEIGFHIYHMPEVFCNSEDVSHKPNLHSYYEIIWFRDGGGVHIIDYMKYKIIKNSVFFLSPGQIHYFNDFKHHNGIIVTFDNAFLEENNEKEDLFIKYNMFNAFDSVPFLTLNEEIVPTLEILVKVMENELKNKDKFANKEMLRSLLKISLINVNRYSEKHHILPLTDTKNSHQVFIKFRREVENCFRKNNSVKEYASKLNVTRRTLENYVKECSGRTPIQFINDRILLEAKRQLFYFNKTESETANYLGFGDLSYFIKFFKHGAGCTPIEFLKIKNPVKMFSPIRTKKKKS